MNEVKFDLKVFLINPNHYQLKDKTNQQRVETITINHKKGLRASHTNLNVAKPSLNTLVQGDFKFYTYCYNQPKSQGYWQIFLPDALGKNQNFDVVEFSYVLFVAYKGNLYATVGGSGFNVIQSYLDTDFGIDFYQHFAKPSEDVLLKVSTRGVAGNISQKNNTFNYDQRISESLEYSEIPTKIKILIRNELLNGVFGKYGIKSDKPIMEVGSYFYLRKKLNFIEFKTLITDIHRVREDKSNYVHLTLFSKVDQISILDDLDNKLKEDVVDDILLHNTPKELHRLNQEVIELINSKKLEKFFECDSFKVRLKRAHKKGDRIVSNKNDLYFECTKHIFQNLKDITDRWSIRGKLYDLNIIGLIGGKEATFGNLYDHIICESTLNGKKYFRIDRNWYQLDDSFLERIQKDAVDTYANNKLTENILSAWNSDWDEEEYNLRQIDNDQYVFDRIIPDNIELCDVLVYRKDVLYFVHVKKGFNAQMRDLYIQIVLAAKRLWNDLYNNSGSSYLIETFNRYNAKNPKKKIDAKTIYNQIINDNLKVEFVMAYNNTAYQGHTSTEKINLSDSNIAKYSLVQTVREMRNYRRFGIKVIDISEIS